MRTLVVGDVHGCADELRALVERAAPDRVVLVGDLYTKGPDPVGVYTQIRAGGFDAVLGNHDERLLKVLAGKRRRDQEAKRCVERLDAGAPGWRDHLAALPLFADAAGYTVVHGGLHPHEGRSGTTRKMALVMRRFPLGVAEAVHWHAQYTASEGVVFGHDAVRGRVRVERDGRPLLIGLDSGCVYGRALSGWVVETDELHEIPAARVYRDPFGKASRRAP